MAGIAPEELGDVDRATSRWRKPVGASAKRQRVVHQGEDAAVAEAETGGALVVDDDGLR